MIYLFYFMYAIVFLISYVKYKIVKFQIEYVKKFKLINYYYYFFKFHFFFVEPKTLTA